MNKDSNIRYSVPSLKSIEESPFCQTCIKNHSFIVNSLASYLPSEDHPDYHVYLSAFPLYRAFLEEQYPVVCDLCSSRVQEHLAKKNYIAKSNTLAGWLLNSKKTIDSKRSLPQSFLRIRLFIWGLRGIGWWIVTCSMVVYYILGTFIPSVFLKSPSQTTSKSIIWGIFVILWDYTWVSQILKPDHRVFGKNYYYICQIFIHIIRAAAEFIVSERISDTSIYSKINIALFFISMAHLVLTFKCVYLIPPISISLYDSNSKDLPIENEQKTNTEFKTMEKISCTDKHDKNLSPLTINHNPKGDQYDTDSCDDSMQLDPPESLPLRMDSKDIHIYNSSFSFPKGISLPMSPSSAFIHSNIHQSNKSFNSQNYFLKSKSNLFKTDQKESDDEIAPQRFFAPEARLETIFSPALRLDDEPLIVRALRIVKHRKLQWIEIISLFWTLEIIIINILNLGRISYYSSFIGSFGITFSLGSNFWFLKRAYIKLIFIGTIISFFYYLFIYIDHYKNFETFLQTSKTFFLCNALITGFYFCYSLRILWIMHSSWNHIPSKTKQKSTRKHQNKIWDFYIITKNI
ncbi:unnamed protein product [Pneumocystis jirovecii]|uniref:Ima1 N-terminal domain-containing protein n=1 Tax=Pneumocystis jirovecii TaxID=42068 RepID=L0PFK5_PNEJI|nr:unnamed protein product [Pneumocystis jirovecii]